MDIFKALAVSTFTWEALQIFKTRQDGMAIGICRPSFIRIQEVYCL